MGSLNKQSAAWTSSNFLLFVVRYSFFVMCLLCSLPQLTKIIHQKFGYSNQVLANDDDDCNSVFYMSIRQYLIKYIFYKNAVFK